MRENIPVGGRIGKRERIMLGVLGVVALGALAFLFLGGDDEVPEPGDLTPRPRPRATPTEQATKPPPETDDNFAGRDPFQPLVTVPVASNGDGNGDGGQDPGDGGVVAPDPGGEARRVTLLDIFEEDGDRMATIDVDGEEFTVGEGETFAESFRLLSLTTKCGTFVFGDERFTLCLGQEVLK